MVQDEGSHTDHASELEGKAGASEQNQRREGLCLHAPRTVFWESQLQLCKNTKAVKGESYTEAYIGDMTEVGSVSHVMSYRCMDSHFPPLAW